MRFDAGGREVRSTLDTTEERPERRGFRIDYANGYTLSVQFGAANYCDQRFSKELTPAESAELGIWKRGTSPEARDGEWVRLCPTDDVRGWVAPETLPEVMKILQDYKHDPSPWVETLGERLRKVLVSTPTRTGAALLGGNKWLEE